MPERDLIAWIETNTYVLGRTLGEYSRHPEDADLHLPDLETASDVISALVRELVARRDPGRS